MGVTFAKTGQVKTGLPALAVALSAILWGVWWVPLRWLDSNGLRGDWASLAIFGLAALALLPFVWRCRATFRAQLVALLAIGVPLGLAMVLWNHAVIHGNIIRVVLLFYLAPIWATLMARFFLGVGIQLSRWAAIACGLGGAAVILELDHLITQGLLASLSLADALAVFSGVCFALATTATRIHDQVGELNKTFVSVFAAAAAALLLVGLTDIAAPSGDMLALTGVALAVALLFLLPTTALLLWGASILDPGRVAILLLLEVVAAAASATLLASEPFGVRELLGCSLILLAGLLEAVPLRRLASP